MHSLRLEIPAPALLALPLCLTFACARRPTTNRDAGVEAGLGGVPISSLGGSGALAAVEGSLFCNTGGTLCPDGQTVCGTSSTCLSGGDCACDHGYTAVDCSGTPCASGGDCSDSRWQCAAEPSGPYEACAIQTQCPTSYFCGSSEPCFLGEFLCLPECGQNTTTVCPSHDGQPMVCAFNPGSAQGGFCTGTSPCSIATQNCPDALLNPMEPAGASNPMVRYNCEPAAPNLNICVPAGMLDAGESCAISSATCTQLDAECGQGLLCVGDSMSASCYQQCTDPEVSDTPAQSPDCPTGQYCAGIAAAPDAGVDTTGVCFALPS